MYLENDDRRRRAPKQRALNMYRHLVKMENMALGVGPRSRERIKRIGT